MDYLEDEQAYIDRYDLLTIRECLKVVEMFQDIYQKSLNSKELKELSENEKYSDATKMMYWQLWLTQAQEYKNKKETLKKWMDADRIKQEKYDSAAVPNSVHCPSCQAQMQVTETKILEDFTDQPMQVMFLFRCTKCKKQEWVYEGGQVRESKPDLCPKCKKEIEVTHTKSKQEKVITWTRKCRFCGHTETEVDDLEKSHKEFLQKEQADKELLEKYRAAFCLTEEEGEKYLFELEAMEYAHQVAEEERQKYDNTAYQQVRKLRKLTIVELEKLLSGLLEKENFIKLSLGNPDIGQYIFVPITLQDGDTSRRENESISALAKLLKDALESTNWRLMDGLTYRLGFLSGRLKGYEREEDLLKLYERKLPEILADTEKRMKYSSSTWVKLAEMRGKQEGIEAVRKRRLEKEPEGFFLTEADGYYDCGICYEGHHGDEIWWNLEGIRCADCWRNIKEGVIPPLKKHLFDNEDEWISHSQLKSRHNVHPSSVKKLRREGLLHGRDLKRTDGSVYETIFLISENQEFLKKYPRVKEGENKTILSLDISGHVAQIGEIPAEANNQNATTTIRSK